MLRTAGGALLLAMSTAMAQIPGTASGPVVTPAPAAPGEPSAPARQDAPPAGRITGIETNREMIAAEAATDIIVNGTGGSCGLSIEFGDGASTAIVVSESMPFPVRLPHVYRKVADPVVRVAGAATGSAPPCLGVAEATLHVSPAGSKIEYVTLSTSCPEGWALRGPIHADKSFTCAPVADASAPTNLIHCVDGMKYFAKAGNIGCMHPAAASAQAPAARIAMTKSKAKGGRMPAGGPPMQGKRTAVATGGAVASTAGAAAPAKPKVKSPKTAPAKPGA